MLRLPGSLHKKYDPVQAELVKCDGDLVYSIGEVVAELPDTESNSAIAPKLTIVSGDKSTSAIKAYNSPPDCQNFNRCIRDVKSEDKLSVILSMVSQVQEPGRNSFLNLAAYAAREHTRSYLSADILAALLLEPALECGLDLEESKLTIKSAIEAVDKTYKGLKQLPLLYTQLRGHYKDSLRFNTRTNQVSKDGVDVSDIDYLRVSFIDSTNISIDATKYKQELSALVARDYSFDPAKEALESMPSMSVEEANEFFSELAVVMGQEVGSHEEMLFKRWSVGLVKRIYEPGCLMNWVLTLKGNSRCGKTSFFKTKELYEGSFDTMKSLNDLQDNYGFRKLLKTTIACFDELDNVLSNKDDMAKLKSIVTQQTFSHRSLYKSEYLTSRIAGVFAATVNGSTPLKDDGAGNTRWCVIAVPGGETEGIDRFAWNEENRERFYSAAIALYRDGYGCLLTKEEQSVEATRKEVRIRMTSAIVMSASAPL